METDIRFGLQQIDDCWHVTANYIVLEPGVHDKRIAKVYKKCLKERGLQSCWDAKETILDEIFKKRNEGR